MSGPAYDAKKKDWAERDARRKHRPAIDYSPALRDGAGVVVASLPHITNEADWRRFFPRRVRG